MTMTLGPRDLWKLTEPIHALTYFAPEAAEAFDTVGLRGFWRGYFAGRAAPLGRVGSPAVTALFYGFEPRFVARAVPSVWSLCSPIEALAARQDGAAEALQAVWATTTDAEASTEPLDRAFEILECACQVASGDPRPLGLSNASLPWPSNPYGRLWHATTILREHRGDGHIAALLSNGLGPCEATVLRSACSDTRLDSIRLVRGWDDDAWDKAGQRLIGRGLLQIDQTASTGTILPDGTTVLATLIGRELHRSVEELTDVLAAGPFTGLAQDYGELESILAPVVAGLQRSSIIPYPNPIGVPRLDR